MNFIENLKIRAKENKKRICLPETMDDRVLKAAVKVLKEDFAEVYLIGNKDEILSKYPELKDATIIEVENNPLTEEVINELYELRREKGMTLDDARNFITTDYMYYACMLVKKGLVDGVVSGACHSTANTLRPSLQIIKTAKNTKIVSAFFLMVTKMEDLGSNGVFIFGDSGLVQDPSDEELAVIANSSAKSFELLVGDKARVAMLSHSTKGSAKHALVDKVISATQIAKREYPDMLVDGELQLDAAIIPEVASSKAPGSDVAGKANVLIFPNLDAGNIGYKLVQRLGGAEAYGPVTQGIAAPVNDLSRGCNVDDIVGVVAITAVQACKE